MAGFFGKWSKTAATNATADSTINMAEGMAPSAVNDGVRALMASVASFRDDRSGSLICGGTSTAYTLVTNQAFAALADMDGQELSFVITPTNGAAATLDVNGLGAKALVFSAGNAMPAASLIDGSIYTATYIHASSCWKVHSVVGNPYNIPIAGGMDFWGTTVPNANFAFPIGQAISRTTYAALFAIMGTTYGVGDGSTTFNLPDKTGRVSAMKEAAATRLTATYFGASGATMGSVGGSESHTLTTAQLAAHNHAVVDPGHTHATTPSSPVVGTSNSPQAGSSTSVPVNVTTLTINSATTGISVSNAGSGNAHNNTQPTIICNYIIRII